MDVFEAMSTCRAIRYLKPDPVPDELIEKCIWAATRAPSPGNSQGWDFVVVTDRAKIAAIGADVEAKMTARVAAMTRTDKTSRLILDGTANLVRTIAQCPVLILVCGKAVYPVEAPREAFVWSALYPAAQNLIVAARALGLGTTFTTFHHVADRVIREQCAIPEDVYISCMIPMGWPAANFGPVERLPTESFIHRDTWQGDLRDHQGVS
jgi:nitroreductase